MGDQARFNHPQLQGEVQMAHLVQDQVVLWSLAQEVLVVMAAMAGEG